MGARISRIQGRMVLDSRGNPTVEVDCLTEDGTLGRAMVPSGASTGRHEAVELRDGDNRWGGKGVDLAVANVNGPIADALVGLDASEQGVVDTAMMTIDSTPNKSKIGANAMLGASMACLRATVGTREYMATPLRRKLLHTSTSDEYPQRRRTCELECRCPGIHGSTSWL